MSAREEILARLHGQANPIPHPGRWQPRQGEVDMAQQFTTALQAAKGEVRRVLSLEAALAELYNLLDELQAERVVVNDEPPLVDIDFSAARPECQWYVSGRAAGDLRHFCAAADVGVSGAVAALAETGTVVIRSGSGRSRLATLLPPVHIALVAEAQLTANLFPWTSARGEAWPANVVLVSGPSKTADIEQTLSVGIHGPGRLIVILYAV